ncbi:MAG: hypothetical protein UW41_C0010G0014 [Candidatus Collierbacteria bacterium GW2011_GWC2_44_18]|uniref:Uncharacterized protein n=2 Tax=Microgenomates group TaxID=1794810 RepID=A0A0G1M605_9BACT|nr:MAG: hypothetical protein UW16_C0032G0011 [Microgenomates group bacterium GW2011_GWC1_44_10]KKT49175.1 MAG: hypothetical protein UW41_C0010G0014 [Candidatus Collierbacteria bacterium GW2011_GWC2_44_18]KKT67344.1 MAG: hypothetical protein UW60_C0008G0006 [Candidatus Woesebacteria bacterium GW2011_GWA2_44_33]
MEKISYSRPDLDNEQARYKHDVAKLEATEGYALLSKDQRAIIRNTLILQIRAERDMDPLHRNDPWYYDWHKRKGLRPRYKGSLEHVKHWYCHAAVAALETRDLSGTRPQNCKEDFFDGDYFQIDQEFELRKAVEFFGFPCIVHVSTELGNSRGETTKFHTFLALGHGPKDEIVVWEKQRIELPYRVVSLSQVYADYKHAHFWGFRKLRSTT